ncbi:hypothetical protein [Companilactobacillus sp. DQM5]|uniref:hypothetical protein n=1 Tax=Companilactobacillus sp. DQM5 TaxID=3463359 RepID=UPI004059FC61
MSVADEFVERRMLKFMCFNCEHPAMLISKKEKIGTNDDGSEKFKIELTCPRCKAVDSFILNDSSEATLSKSENSERIPDASKVL